MEHLNSVWMWIGFSLFFAFALSIDTFLIGKYRARQRETWRAALFWTLFWIACSLIFNLALWIYLLTIINPESAHQFAIDFFTAWLVEKSLSLDNLFVFYLIFRYFKIPIHNQHRVLTYGIWGAVIMRLVIILVGIWLISKFHWLLYLMGAFLLYTGIKVVFSHEDEKDFSETTTFKLCKRYLRVTNEFHGEQFFVRINKLLYATPLFITLILVELSDLVFASDSIPAVLAITREPFIVWSSNIFALLGLRAMYFLLARLVHELELLQHGIGLILIYIGTKMLIEPWYDIPSKVSLIVIAVILLVFTVLSVMLRKVRDKK
jgi:tellurite resistance protein TerC